MIKQEREIPEFLISSKYIWATITFIVLFSALFMIIYGPYSLAVWFSTEDMLQFSFTILFYVAAIVVLIISRWVMYKVQDRVSITLVRYVWWLMGENFIISLLYTLITVSFFPLEGASTPNIAVRALFCVTMILAIPNVLVSFYATYRAKCEELEAREYELSRLGEEYRRLESMKELELLAMASAQKQTPAERTPRMIQLYDNNGTLRLTINVDALYLLESEDNYIKVHYKHNDKITSYMLRCKTSTLERELKGTIFVRCHRSYIVNINKISMLSDVDRLHYITLDDNTMKRIPVSKNYYPTLLEALNAQRVTLTKGEEA